MLLLHGIWNARLWLSPLARKLRAAGFEPQIWGYDSVLGGPAQAVPALIDALRDGPPTHVVGHSLGGLVALEALLQRDGLDILKAQSGPEALELLLAHDDVALALLDVQMPEMNGFELAELIRGSERTRHIPLIFMTAGSREQNWQFRGYESGAVDFLYKPIDPHMLTNKAGVFFELHRRKQALAHELRARTEALRINEMFMAVLSHDLRSPLTAILTAAMVLQRDPGSDKVQALATQVQNSGRRMGRMIEDLLDVARVRQRGGLALGKHGQRGAFGQPHFFIAVGAFFRPQSEHGALQNRLPQPLR